MSNEFLDEVQGEIHQGGSSGFNCHPEDGQQACIMHSSCHN